MNRPQRPAWIRLLHQQCLDNQAKLNARRHPEYFSGGPYEGRGRTNDRVYDWEVGIGCRPPVQMERVCCQDPFEWYTTPTKPADR